MEDLEDLTAALASEIAFESASSICKVVTKSEDEMFATASLVQLHKAKVEEFYEIADILGEGSFGSVSSATHKATGASRAIKAMTKKKVERKELEAEIEIMKHLDHPNIVKLYEVFEDYVNIHLVLELCTGGELFQRIVEEECFAERQAAAIMQQVMGGLLYCHRKCVCHRDIKPENFLLQVPGRRWCPVEQCVIKIIDFGVASKFEEGKQMTTKIGTPFYVAPQVLDGSYTESCDLWSCGVIMYILLCGYPPFTGETETELIPRIKACCYCFPEDDWDGVSDDAKDLIQKLICLDPAARYTAAQTMGHIWVKNQAPRAREEPLKACTLTNMRAFRGNNNLKKAALQVIAQRLKEDDIKQLKDMFLTLDSNSDGTVTFQELSEGIEKLNISGFENLKDLMQEMDADGSGCIEYTEFLAATLDQQQYNQENVCWAAFQVFDADGSGSISRSELEQVLSNGELEKVMGSKAIQRVMSECDADNDGNIDFSEFMEMMRRADE